MEVFRRSHECSAISYVNAVWEVYGNDRAVLTKFHKILVAFAGNCIGVFQAALRIAILFQSHPRLYELFSIFLPQGYFICKGVGSHIYLVLPRTDDQRPAQEQSNLVDLRRNYVSLHFPRRSDRVTEDLCCRRHPLAIFTHDRMCPNCYRKRARRVTFEDFKNFIDSMRSELRPDFFQLFIRSLNWYQFKKFTFSKIIRNCVFILRHDRAHFYELLSFFTNDQNGILFTERAKDYVEYFIPVPIDIAEVVIGADSNDISDEHQIGNVLEQVQQNLTNAAEPRRSERLQSLKSSTCDTKALQVRPSTQTATDPVNASTRTYPQPSTRLRRSISPEPTYPPRQHRSASHEPTPSTRPPIRPRSFSHEPPSSARNLRSISHGSTSSPSPRRSISREPLSSTRARCSTSHETTRSSRTRRSIGHETTRSTRTRRSIGHETTRSTRTRHSIGHETTRSTRTRRSIGHESARFTRPRSTRHPRSISHESVHFTRPRGSISHESTRSTRARSTRHPRSISHESVHLIRPRRSVSHEVLNSTRHTRSASHESTSSTSSPRSVSHESPRSTRSSRFANPESTRSTRPRRSVSQKSQSSTRLRL